MTLLGLGAVAIWHDLLPEAKEEFYRWHNREHMPERMAIPGFNRGRRYIALGDGPEFFNLYEADSVAVLAGPDYLERLNNPTGWTRAVVASFRDVARSICRVRFSQGVGDGGYVQTLRFEAEQALDTVSRVILPPLAAGDGISSVHLLAEDVATSRIETRERAARGEAAEIPPHVVLIEGVSPRHVEAAGDAFLAALKTEAQVPVSMTTYALEHAARSHC